MTSKVSSGLGSSDEMNISTEETFGKRFLKDFEEKEVLGIGHFGQVIRVINKLDQIEYAVKVSQKPSPKRKSLLILGRVNMDEALQEVYALAALSATTESPHIV